MVGDKNSESESIESIPADMDNHHVQKAVLKHFAEQVGGKYKIRLINLKTKQVGKKNVGKAFCIHGLYFNNLEIKLNKRIEKPCLEIFNKIYSNNTGSITLTRRQLYVIQKYLLIQRYRSPLNIESYSPDNDDPKFSTVKIEYPEGVDYHQYVFNLMTEILERNWEKLEFSEIPEIARNVCETKYAALMFVRTKEEFVTNDHGTATENSHYNIRNEITPEIREQIIKDMTAKSGKTPSETEVENYLDCISWRNNYQIFPIASNLALILVEPTWTIFFKQKTPYSSIIEQGFFSPFLMKNYKSPSQEYVKYEKMIEPVTKHGYTEESVKAVNENILKYTRNKDKFHYRIVDLDLLDTTWLNHLLMNEADRYIGLRTPEKILPFIESYSRNTLFVKKHNLSWIHENMGWDKDLKDPPAEGKLHTTQKTTSK